MAASAKHLAITLCLLGLMARSACAASETLNNQGSQDFVHGVPSRRLKLPRMYNIYHIAPAPPPENYAEPASPTPEESYDAPPTASPPSSMMENDSTVTAQKPNPDAPVTLEDMCGENQCVCMWIDKDMYFMIKYA